jgi:V/A-type H+-transporting ATPase subunit G/H
MEDGDIMPLQAIKKVAEAEQYAQEIREGTQAKIKKIKADSEREGRERLDLALGRATEETKRLMTEAEKKASLHTDAILEQSRQDCVALKVRAADRFDQAIDLIVERIVVN